MAIVAAETELLAVVVFEMSLVQVITVRVLRDTVF
jgi:hypothetical protein